MNDPERDRETAEARDRLLRAAGERGVRPFDHEEWRGESTRDQTPEEVTREVDDFLLLVREVRGEPSPARAG